jgi:hypothetical protein
MGANCSKRSDDEAPATIAAAATAKGVAPERPPKQVHVAGAGAIIACVVRSFIVDGLNE